MLHEVEAELAERYEKLNARDQAYFFCKFNRAEGDVRCCAHIYNIAVQAALKSLNSEALDNRNHYQQVVGQARLPEDQLSWSAFYKARCLAMIFKYRKVPRQQLKDMCKTLNITFYELVCDMPVRWNSTDKLLNAFLKIEKAIRAVLSVQEWDKTVRANMTPSEEDWKLLKELSLFFQLFSRPTVQSQADKYATLHNVIPNYLHLLRQLNVWQLRDDKPYLKLAAASAHTVLDKYFRKSMSTRHSFVAMICDPRFKLQMVSFLFDADGGAQSPQYIKAKAHFERVYSDYKSRTVKIREFHRQEAENAEINAEEARYNREGSLEDEDMAEGQEGWKIDPFDGFDAHMAAQGAPGVAQPAAPGVILTEVERWFTQPLLARNSTPEQQLAYMISKAAEFPIITQMARDFMAIPATSAPSERVFSQAGNLISKKRTRIASDMVRYVLCLRSWGLLPPAQEEEDIQIGPNGDILEPPDNAVVGRQRAQDILE